MRWSPLVEYEPRFGSTVQSRLRELIACVPAGRVATYAQLVGWAGAKPAGPYLRTVPSILKQGNEALSGDGSGGGGGASAGEDLLPVWRVVDSKRLLVRKYVPSQAERLRREGVELSEGEGGAVAEAALWEPSHAELFLRRSGGSGV
jgi:alkylated DNA nucleotide flippase Atl1